MIVSGKKPPSISQHKNRAMLFIEYFDFLKYQLHVLHLILNVNMIKTNIHVDIDDELLIIIFLN